MTFLSPPRLHSLSQHPVSLTLSLADDRKDMSCAYENGKLFMASRTSNDLLALARIYHCAPTAAGSLIATAALLAAKQLITSEESVQVMSRHGAMELPLAIFTLYLANNEAQAQAEVSSGDKISSFDIRSFE